MFPMSSLGITEMIPCNDAFESLYRLIQSARVKPMSVRENIQFYPGVNIEQYMEVFKTDYGAEAHPAQPGALLVDGLPFYSPQTAEDHTFILGFNYVPLPDVLLDALIRHTEHVSDTLLIRWTQEQDLLFETTLKDLRTHLEKVA